MYGQWDLWAEGPDGPDWTPKYRQHIRQYASNLVSIWGEVPDPDRA